MKTVVKIPLTSKAKIIVNVGDSIDKGDTLATLGEDEKEIEINLSQILKVKAHDIYKYLKKKLTEEIMFGELIAEKKSLITTLSVKSPIKGKIKEVDLKKGAIILITVSETLSKKIVVPVNGKIKNIGKESIEIEVNGTKITASYGRGREEFGELVSIKDVRNSIFEIDIEVEDKILLSLDGPSDLMAKLDTLGARGLIAKSCDRDFNFSYLEVSDEPYKNLSKNIGKLVWIRPAEREVIVIED